ncbi:MAG: hypothetical protein ABI832_16770, partial [bacterium]
ALRSLCANPPDQRIRCCRLGRLPACRHFRHPFRDGLTSRQEVRKAVVEKTIVTGKAAAFAAPDHVSKPAFDDFAVI